MRKEMLHWGFIWYVTKRNFVIVIGFITLVIMFLFSSNIFPPQKAKIQSKRLYTDGTVFVKANSNWILVDDTIKVKGKYVFLSHSKLADTVQYVAFAILFIFFSTATMRFKVSYFTRLWCEYNKDHIKRIEYPQNYVYYTLFGRIISKVYTMAESTSNPYPILYDRIEIRTNTIKNILK